MNSSLSTLNIGRTPCNALLLCLLVGCGSSSDSSSDQDNLLDNAGNPTPTQFFTESDAVNERFGLLSTRNLSPQIDATTSAAIVNALNNFSFDMHRVISAANPTEGSVESGFSAAVALLLAGAATGGDTYSALSSLMGVDGLVENDVHVGINDLSLMLESRANDDLILHIANRVFVKPDLDLTAEFLDRATGDYGAPVTEADFETSPDEVADEINGWVADQTNDFIPAIIDRLPTNTVFALLNAIFLDAQWADTYESVGEQPFTNADGTVTNVESFSGRSALPRLIRDDLSALEIPYGGNELAMLILMPEDLANFEATLSASTLSDIVSDLSVSDVRFTVPNWKQGSTHDLVDLLTPIGLPQSPWDFARLVNGGIGLEVIAIQKAEIEVDENGTRAAAVTLVGGIESVPEVLSIDRPFTYVLRDRTTGVVLFSGRVVSP